MVLGRCIHHFYCRISAISIDIRWIFQFVRFQLLSKYLVSEIICLRLIDKTVGNVDLTEIMFVALLNILVDDTLLFLPPAAQDDNARKVNILPVAYQ